MTRALGPSVLEAVARRLAPHLPPGLLDGVAAGGGPRAGDLLPGGSSEALPDAPRVPVDPQLAAGYAAALGVTVSDIAALAWRQSQRSASLGDYVRRNCFCSLYVRDPQRAQDPTGERWTNGLRIGLFALEPHTDYPRHSHAANELYLLLEGDCHWALWEEGEGEAAAVHPVGPAVLTSSWQPHALETRQKPALMAYVWWGDSRFDQYKVG